MTAIGQELWLPDPGDVITLPRAPRKDFRDRPFTVVSVKGDWVYFRLVGENFVYSNPVAELHEIGMTRTTPEEGQ